MHFAPEYVYESRFALCVCVFVWVCLLGGFHVYKKKTNTQGKTVYNDIEEEKKNAQTEPNWKRSNGIFALAWLVSFYWFSLFCFVRLIIAIGCGILFFILCLRITKACSAFCVYILGSVFEVFIVSCKIRYVGNVHLVKCILIWSY